MGRNIPAREAGDRRSNRAHVDPKIDNGSCSLSPAPRAQVICFSHDPRVPLAKPRFTLGFMLPPALRADRTEYQAASWWALRTDGDPAALAGAVREVVRRAGSETLINEMQPMDSLVVQAQAHTRFSLLLIGVFSTIAARLAGVGLYGVLATTV